MIKLLLDKQIFASSDARFCCDMCNDGCNKQNFGRNMHNAQCLDMVLSPKYVSMKPRGGLDPPNIHEKNSMSKIDF